MKEEKITLQKFANSILSPEWQMPLMTAQDACLKVGWKFQDRPECCGIPVEICGFIGCAYECHCKTCRRFIFDVTGPEFGNSWVNIPDSDKVDMETEERWIAGVYPADANPKPTPEK